MRRVWTALLLLLTAVVVAGAGYVLVHKTPVPNAGEAPSVSPASGDPVSSTSPPSSSSSSAPISGSSGPTHAVSVVFLGDNYTLGKGDDSGKGFANPVAQSLGFATVKTVATNNGGYAKMGDDGNNYVDLVPKVVKDKPDVVIVTGGRNDRTDDPSALTDAAKSVFSKLHSALPDATLIAVKPFFGDSPHPSDLGMVDTAVQNGVTAAGGTYIPLTDPLFDHANYMADDANPNAAGYAAIASALEPKLTAILDS